jgi:NADP-dependent 3-hydroxy acid dehydrogenase YdfG
MVIGAAGGIGSAIAVALHPDFLLCLADSNAGELSDLHSRLGVPDAITRAVDIVSQNECEDVVKLTEDRLGPVDLLVIAAGVSAPGGATERHSERWRHAWEVNCLGTMQMCREVLPGMIERGHGTVVVIASVSGRVTYAGEIGYVASKHAVVAYVECLRKELVGTGVRVCLVEPGLVDTPMSRSHPSLEGLGLTAGFLDPSDVAAAVRYVAMAPSHVAVNELVIRPVGQSL